MTAADYHLAQANIAHMKAPIDDPLMAGFVARLEPVNRCADRSPGFVWRLQTDDGDATGVRVFDDERLLFNMSVWTSIEALHSYVYRSLHVGPMGDRTQWFERLERPHLVLWWLAAGRLPTVADAEERFEHLWAYGPTPFAFTFKSTYRPPIRVSPISRAAGSGPAASPPETDA